MLKSALFNCLDLSGRAVIVTGSTSGIGRAIACHLAYSGCDVMLNGFGNSTEIESFRLNLASETGRKIKYSNADLTNLAQIEEMVEFTRAEFGKIDCVVNNAGLQYVSPLENFPPEKWETIISLNLSAAFHLSRLVFQEFKEQRWGRVINICSAHGIVASPYKSAYVAAKHGIIGLTKTIALEGAEYGVRANAICPGYVLTPLVEMQIEDTANARCISKEDVINNVMLASQPTKEFVSVDEIGRLTCFLLSDAAKSINGAEIKIDGGWTAA